MKWLQNLFSVKDLNAVNKLENMQRFNDFMEKHRERHEMLEKWRAELSDAIASDDGSLAPHERAALYAVRKWAQKFADIYYTEPKRFGADAMLVYLAARAVYDNRDDVPALEKALHDLPKSSLGKVFGDYLGGLPPSGSE